MPRLLYDRGDVGQQFWISVLDVKPSAWLGFAFMVSILCVWVSGASVEGLGPVVACCKPHMSHGQNSLSGLHRDNMGVLSKGNYQAHFATLQCPVMVNGLAGRRCKDPFPGDGTSL